MSPRDTSYAGVMARKNEIMKVSLGIDYDRYVHSPVAGNQGGGYAAL